MPGQGLIVGRRRARLPHRVPGRRSRSRSPTSGCPRSSPSSSTYDHRIIQGAESGLFLKRVHELLLGADDFYDDVFRSLGVPYEAVQWRRDVNPVDREQSMLEKQMQVDRLINMHRVRGHLIADLDPLSAEEPEMHPELDPATYGLTIWDLDREFLTSGVGGARSACRSATSSTCMRDAYCRTIGIEYMHIQDPEEKRWIQEQVEGVAARDHHRRAAPHPRPAQRGRGARAVPGHEVRRPEALRHRRRRERHPHPRRAPHRGRRRPHGLRGHGHGPPRPAQRARQHRGQELRAAVQGVRGQRRPRLHPGLGRRQVPPRPDRQVRQPPGQHHPRRARRQPVAPRGRRPRRGRHGPGQDGPDRAARRLPGAADPASTATPPSPARASWPRRSTCPTSGATRSAARST